MVAFSHLDAGTAESLWEADGRLSQIAELDLSVGRLIVVAAHPDDETLGAAGLMARLCSAGAPITVVIATDGEGSHPASVTHSAAQLAVIRREEVQRAVHVVAPSADIRFLKLADSGLREQRELLRDRLAGVLGEAASSDGGVAGTLVVAPWSGDGHRDHRVTAEVVGELCAARGIRHLGYPIWLWHWGTPGDVPWGDSRALTLTPEERAAKRSALDEHRTQIHPLSPNAGDEPVLHDLMQAHFLRSREVFIHEAAPVLTMSTEHFEDFYRRHEDDPWGFESRWYEQRKRDVLMASLPLRRLGHVLELGCATGLLTAELARRADTVTAVDAVASAVAAARRRVPDDDVRLIVGRLPEDWPAGRFDTVVLSEIGYYFSDADLGRLVERIQESAVGCVAACHWRHPVARHPQTGDAVHGLLRRMTGWQTTVLHQERDFVLEVFERTPVQSVAQREGLA